MRCWVVWAAVGLLTAAGAAGAYEQRSGTFSFGGELQLDGLLTGNGEFAPFDLGNDGGLDGVAVGLGIRLRVGVDRASAVGINFEALNFDRTLSELADFELSSTAQDTSESVHLTVITAEYTRFFRRKTQDSVFLSVGGGYYRPEIRFGEINTRFPDSSVLMTLGGGIEHFFTRSTSIEIGARTYGILHDGGVSVAGSVALGLRFYHLTGRRRR